MQPEWTGQKRIERLAQSSGELPGPDRRAVRPNDTNSPVDDESDEIHPLERKLDLPKDLPGAETPPIELGKFDPEHPERRQAKIDKMYPELPPFWPLTLPGLRPGEKPTTLEELQRLAAERNPSIAQARADIGALRGVAIQAGLYPNPIFGFQSDTVSSSRLRDYQGATISQTIKTAGKLTLARNVANMDVANAQLALQRVRIYVSSQVKKNYFDVLVAERNIQIGNALVEFTERVYRVKTEQVKEQESVPYEPAQLRSLVYQARSALAAAHISYARAWKMLAVTVGVPDLPPSKLENLLDQPVPDINYQTALARVLAVHPDMQAARNSLAQARTQLRLDIVTPIPDVTALLVAEKDFTTPHLQNVSTNSNLLVTVPIFDRNQGNIMRSQGVVARMQQQLRKAQYDLTQQLADSFAQYENNRKQARYYRDLVIPDLALTYRGVAQRHLQRPEVIMVTDVAFAQQNLSVAINTYIGFLYGEWLSIADLANLLQVDNLRDINNLGNAPVGTPPDQPATAGMRGGRR
jgi:outer membrane protein, heavy metal efflux system